MGKAEFRDEVIAKIRHHLFTSIETWLPRVQSTGNSGYKVCNPTRGDRNPDSMHIYPDGKAFDFATGQSLDTIDLWAAVNSMSNADAILHHAGRLGLVDEKPSAKVLQLRVQRPPPPDAPPAYLGENFQHPKHGIPTAAYIYRNLAGAIIGYTCRFETGDGAKVIPPFTYNLEKAAWGWSGEGWRGHTPIYGAEQLQAHPSAMILIVEGEKTKDAAAKLLPEYLVISWLGGTGKAGKVDWSPLGGHAVIIWPNADLKQNPRSGELLPLHEQPGMKAALTIARDLEALGIKAGIVMPPEGMPDGWDLADTGETGWTREKTLMQLNANVRSVEEITPSKPNGVKMAEDGANVIPITSLGNWKTPVIVADIRDRFDRCSKDERLSRAFPITANYFLYSPKLGVSNMRKPPSFIAEVSADERVSLVETNEFTNQLVRWYDSVGSLLYGGINLNEHDLLSLGRRLVQRLPPLPSEPKIFKIAGEPGLAWCILDLHLDTEVEVDGSEDSAMELLKSIPRHGMKS